MNESNDGDWIKASKSETKRPRKPGIETFADITYDAGFKAVLADEANKDVLINVLNAILPPDVASFSKEKRQLYERNMATEMDRRAAFAYALEKATKEAAREAAREAHADGLAEGEAKGRAEGISEGKIETAKAMLADGVAIEKVVLYSGLPLEQVTSLM